MNNFLSHAKRFLKSEDGPTATEYAVMLALVIVVLIAGIKTFATKVQGTFSTVEAAL